jgi:hypothetical protein
LQLLIVVLITMAGMANAQTTVNIHAIQTDLPDSPYMGDSVTTEGIVIAVLSDGFYIENSSSTSHCTDSTTLNCWDESTATAEGIFVYAGATLPSSAVVGYLVEVTGTVAISNSSADADAQGAEIVLSGTPTLVSTGNSIPTAVPSAALASAVTGAFGQWLDFEGMRIDISSLTTTSGSGGTLTTSSQTVTSNGQFWGVLTDTDRPFRATGISELETVPSSAPSTVSRWSGNPSLLFIDSAIRGGTALNLTEGETVTDLIGVVDYHESALGYTGVLLDPSSGYGSVSGASTGTAATSPSTGQITIATQDLDGFYDTSTISSSAYTRRIAKTALAIVNFENSPDILAVQSAGSQTALEALASQVSSDGGPSYTAYWYAGNDSTGLTNGFLVNTSKIDIVSIEQIGASATYTTTSGSSATLFDRPPLVLQAGIPRSGTTDYDITVIDSEMLDRTNVDSSTLGADARAKREAQAVYLADLIQTYQTAGDHVLAAGDYHAFEFSDGFVDTIGAIDGDPVSSSLVTLSSTSDLTDPNLENLTTTATSTDRYSYVENGSAEEPDHILVTSDLESTTTIGYARFGADFPLIDLNDDTTALAASNHDGVIAYLTVPYLTTLTLTSSLNPSYYGDSVTFTATATSPTGTPTGTVTFYDGSTELGTGTLSSESATYTTSTLTVGSHTIKAVYGGDSSHESATATLVQVIKADATTLTLASSLNPSDYGSSVTFTATAASSTGTPSGTVTFYDGSTELGTGTLSSETATFSISTLSISTHTIKAVYGGDSTHASATATLSQVVDKVVTTTSTLTCSPNPAAYQNTVTCTDTVTAASGTASGTAVFYDGSTTLGTVTLSSGVATYSTSTLTVGSHSIKAVFTGVVPYGSSTSNVVDEIITSNFTLEASPTSRSVYTGEAAGYAVAVVPDTGFTLDVALTCSGLPSDSTCTFSPSTITGGSGKSELVIQTTAPSKATTASSVLPTGSKILSVLAVIALLLMPKYLRRRSAWMVALIVSAAVAVSTLSGCCVTSTATGGTPAGTYTITLTGIATDGSLDITHTATVTLKVKSLF